MLASCGKNYLFHLCKKRNSLEGDRCGACYSVVPLLVGGVDSDLVAIGAKWASIYDAMVSYLAVNFGFIFKPLRCNYECEKAKLKCPMSSVMGVG